ncbi:hypothetical protein BDL97_17G030300 [Sphagnum fallax]|jgi:hypothetical protein|nr:hypothetical protein BDL97_17G030300 [Sphagnum fallax]
MGTPGETIAVGSPEGVLEDLTGCLQGWKRKLFMKKSGIQKKKDVSFLAPDGEELRNKRQLDKYLKNHPGSLTASDFDWRSGGGSPGETPRRSARLSSKGRLSSDSIEGEADAELVNSKRAKRQVRENGKDSSPKTQAKNGAGKDELIQDAEKPDEKVASEEHDTVGEEAQKPLDETVVEKNGEVEKENETEEPKPMDVDAPLPDSKDIVAGDSAAKTEETIAEPLAAPGEDVVPVVEETKIEVPTEAVPDALVAEEEKVAPEAAVVADLKPEETVKEQAPTDQVDPPQPHGVHALVDNAAEVGGGPKPEGEVSQAPVGAPDSTLEPVV